MIDPEEIEEPFGVIVPPECGWGCLAVVLAAILMMRGCL